MARISLRWCVTSLVVVFAHQVVATERGAKIESAEVLEFTWCRSLPDAASRLGCFDRAAAALERAVQAGELIVVEKARVEEARRLQFGLPDNGKDVLGAEGPEAIRGTIRTVRSGADGWVVTLEDGSIWQQIGSATSGLDPRAGLAVTIKRGALGSYRLVLSPHAAFKVRRAR